MNFNDNMHSLEVMTTITLLKQHRDLSSLFISILISQLGTWFTYMLFVVRIFNQTENELHTMLIVGAEAVAGLIGGQLAGLIVERQMPKKVLRTSDWISAIIIAGVFFVPVNVLFYSAFGFLIAFVNAFRAPAFEKYLVAAVAEKDLMQANAAFQTAREMIKIVGPALAVSVLALLPMSLKNLGFLADASSYAVSALLLIGLTEANRKYGSEAKETEEDTGLSWFQKWLEGLVPLKDPVIFNVFAILLLLLFAVAGADVVLTSHIHESGLNSYDVGYVIGALGLGILMTSALGAKYISRLPLTAQLGFSALLLGICYGMIGWGQHFITMMTASFLMGIFNAVYNMSSSTFWQTKIPYERLGRFFSFATSIFSMVTLIGMAANAYISHSLSAGLDIILCGSVISFAGLILIVNMNIVQKKKNAHQKQNETA